MFELAILRAGASSPSRPRVCILGGGFGGLYTAVRLQSLIWPQGKSPQVIFQYKYHVASPSPVVIESACSKVDLDLC